MNFSDEAIWEIARLSAEVNRTVENIGARRLHTVVEKLMEDYSFEASEMAPGTVIEVSKEEVSEKLGDILTKTDLKKFVL